MRAAVGAVKSTPIYFTDEYLYAELATLAATGRPLVRGASPHFPALLQPVLTAPAWLLGDTHGRVCGDQARGRAGDVAGGGSRLPPRAPARAATIDGTARRRRGDRPAGDALLPRGSSPSRTRTRSRSVPSRPARSRSAAAGAGAASPCPARCAARRDPVARVLPCSRSSIATLLRGATVVVGLLPTSMLASQHCGQAAFVLCALRAAARRGAAALAAGWVLGIYGAVRAGRPRPGLAQRSTRRRTARVPLRGGWVVLPARSSVSGWPWPSPLGPRARVRRPGRTALASRLLLQASALRRPRPSAGAHTSSTLIPLVALLLLPLRVTRLASCPRVCAARRSRASCSRDRPLVRLRRRRGSRRSRSFLFGVVPECEQSARHRGGLLAVRGSSRRAGSVLAAALRASSAESADETIGLAGDDHAPASRSVSRSRRASTSPQHAIVGPGRLPPPRTRLGRRGTARRRDAAATSGQDRTDTLTQLFWNRSLKQVIVAPAERSDTFASPGGDDRPGRAPAACLGSAGQGRVLADVRPTRSASRTVGIVAGTATLRAAGA